MLTCCNTARGRVACGLGGVLIAVLALACLWAFSPAVTAGDDAPAKSGPKATCPEPGLPDIPAKVKSDSVLPPTPPPLPPMPAPPKPDVSGMVPCPPVPGGTLPTDPPLTTGPAKAVPLPDVVQARAISVQAMGPGRLVRSPTAIDGRPTYVLESAQTTVIAYLTPQAGVDLERYIDQTVRVFGDSEQRSNYRAPYMKVIRVLPLPAEDSAPPPLPPGPITLVSGAAPAPPPVPQAQPPVDTQDVKQLVAHLSEIRADRAKLDEKERQAIQTIKRKYQEQKHALEQLDRELRQLGINCDETPPEKVPLPPVPQ